MVVLFFGLGMIAFDGYPVRLMIRPSQSLTDDEVLK
jgi:hypothetical protein